MSFKNLLLFLMGMGTVVSIIMLSSYTEPKQLNGEDESPAQQQGEKPIQMVKVPKMPDSVSLAGESLPMDNFDAKERFDRELLSNCFQHASMIMNIKLASRYFPIIEPILAKNGIPDDFKYLAVAESNLRNAISSAGAKGIWQFMDATAKEYGMMVSNEVDERYDLEKSTEAACFFLKKAYKDFGSWTLAAASYNMGPGGLRQAIQAQGVSNYYDLHLNNETSRYILRIVAIKEIMKSPKKYGFYIDKDDLYPPFPAYREVEINEPLIKWAEFAKQHGVSYRSIRLHNPWIISAQLNNRQRHTFKVKIPQGK